MNAAHTDAHDSQNTSAEAAAASLRGRIRPLPAETDDETFLPFLHLCFNWSMDKPRIELDDLRHRSDAVFYYRDWGRDGDIAVAAHAEADAQSPIVGLAWVRLADIEDVVGRADERVGGDFASALDKTGTEVVRSEVVPGGDAEAEIDSEADAEAAVVSDAPAVTGTDKSAEAAKAASAAAEPEPTEPAAADLTPSGDRAPFTGYGWVAADIPELSMAVLPDHQGQGIGGVLLDTVCALARMSGFPAISLSVEDGNGAAKLYADHGFVSVGRNGTSDVLVRKLG
ncbi:Acetyltransferase (GNAT) family protein [Brevibacterium siliguriense]|uniref:Acetyltransferase (GNAT) family protein n=1 Tax=Brevibacterium siliguriense TaxID=1136497 RepID=A0A1H1T364_9MICO|nr:GNAT family N-acetyltransferase [Brevibacterium siliguriense]SDS54563.1 Acetyltransferase (GNAT) family protein [Brevibacterium siliguriense]